VNGFDERLLLAVNALVRRSPSLDLAVTELASAHVLKGGLLVAVWAAIWAAPGPAQARRRELVVAAGIASAAALALGRGLALALPYRARPLQDPALDLVAPYGDAELLLRGWSSFPSDHAMLFGAMATALLFVSRPLGAVAHAWCAAAILFPRVYLGLHHPTDVLAGLALGVVVAAACCSGPGRRALAAPALALARRRPAAGAAVAMLAAVQLANMFGDARKLAQGALGALRVARCELGGAGSPEGCLAAHRALVARGIAPAPAASPAPAPAPVAAPEVPAAESLPAVVHIPATAPR
jgi:undecaprenyl-diphosphatase